MKGYVGDMLCDIVIGNDTDGDPVLLSDVPEDIQQEIIRKISDELYRRLAEKPDAMTVAQHTQYSEESFLDLCKAVAEAYKRIGEG